MRMKRTGITSKNGPKRHGKPPGGLPSIIPKSVTFVKSAEEFYSWYPTRK
jgi:hypothetical protein